MEQKDLFVSLAAQGVSKEDASAYIKWLENEGKDNAESRIKTPLDVVYLTADGKAVECQPYLDLTRLGEVWGIRIEYVLWCRLQNQGDVSDLPKILHEESVAKLMPVNVTQMGEVAYRLSKGRLSGFFAKAGSLYLDCYVPSESDMLWCYREVAAFNEMIALFQGHGIIADPWDKDDIVCAQNSETEPLVKVNPETLQVSSVNKDKGYFLRPVHLLTNKDTIFPKRQ